MSSKAVGSGRVEGLWSDSLEPESSHHGIEEDLQEYHVVSISGLHDLDPLDSDLEFVALMFSFIDRQVCALAKTVEAGSPVNIEF